MVRFRFMFIFGWLRGWVKGEKTGVGTGASRVRRQSQRTRWWVNTDRDVKVRRTLRAHRRKVWWWILNGDVGEGSTEDVTQISRLEKWGVSYWLRWKKERAGAGKVGPCMEESEAMSSVSDDFCMICLWDGPSVWRQFAERHQCKRSPWTSGSYHKNHPGDRSWRSSFMVGNGGWWHVELMKT